LNLAFALAAFVGVVGRDDESYLVIWLPQQFHPNGLHIGIVGAVAEVAVVVLAAERGSQRQGIAERHVQKTLHLNEIVVANPDRAAGLVVERWVIGDDVDHARHGVAAVERALGAAQHLDSTHVVQSAAREFGLGLINSINVEIDLGITDVRRHAGADAANVERRAVLAFEQPDRADRGHDLIELRLTLAHEVIAGNNRDRYRCLLCVSHASFRRDDDFFKASRGDCIGSPCGRRAGLLRTCLIGRRRDTQAKESCQSHHQSAMSHFLISHSLAVAAGIPMEGAGGNRSAIE